MAAVRSPQLPVPPLQTVPPYPPDWQPGKVWEDFLRQVRDTMSAFAPPGYNVAQLPTTASPFDQAFEGRIAFALNGRKSGEGAGVGSGVPVYFSNGSWRVFRDDSVVTS